MIWQCIKSWWSRLWRRAADRPPDFGLMLLDASARRMARVARREGIAVEDLDDSLTLMATESHLTHFEILALVEEHGLVRAETIVREGSRER